MCDGVLLPTVSKSIDVNLKSLRKKGGSLMLLLRWAMMTLDGRPFGTRGQWKSDKRRV
jgi:hypothetical protein